MTPFIECSNPQCSDRLHRVNAASVVAVPWLCPECRTSAPHWLALRDQLPEPKGHEDLTPMDEVWNDESP